MTKIERARAALLNIKAPVHRDLIPSILASLADAGVFDQPTASGPVNAASSHVSKIRAAIDDPAKVGSAGYALGILGRLGLDANDLDIHKLNTVMAQRGMPIDDRVALKTACARCEFID